MSDESREPQLYRIEVSGQVNERLVQLFREAKARGDGAAFVAALREFYNRLRVYPQFGDPLSDLIQQEGHVRLGIVPPLTMRYAVLEEDRRIFLAALPVLMPQAKPRSGS